MVYIMLQTGQKGYKSLFDSSQRSNERLIGTNAMIFKSKFDCDRLKK